jgi:hypothetical protein
LAPKSTRQPAFLMINKRLSELVCQECCLFENNATTRSEALEVKSGRRLRGRGDFESSLDGLNHTALTKRRHPNFLAGDRISAL